MQKKSKWIVFLLFVLLVIGSLVFKYSPLFYGSDDISVEKGGHVSIKTLDVAPEQLTASQEAEIDKLVAPIPPNWVGDFDGIRKRNYIRILVPYSKTFFSVDRGKQHGIDYDFGKALEKWINKKYPSQVKTRPFAVLFIPVKRDQLLPDLVAGKGDIAAGGLTVTADRQKDVDFVSPFASGVREVLVTVPDYPPVSKIDDLSGKEITIRASSSYFEHLTAINTRLKEMGLQPTTIISADESLESEDLLEMVNAGLIQATVVDRYLAQIWLPLYTEMKINDSLYINDTGELAWAIRKDSPQLSKMLNSFMKEHKVGTTFGNILVKRYVENPERVLNPTSKEEMQKFENLVELFKLHGNTYNFDYLMLMAQGYQESMLDQKARSHRGAVGIMQILPSTAADPVINIKGIEKDPAKNIEAGAKYLRFLTDKYLSDEDITPSNQTLMAFAAYNAGPGNLLKFRRLAEKSGQDPNIWFHNVEYAAARITGQETVKYVANIYKYYLAYKLVTAMQESQKKPLTN
ncbi:MltF family protein [Desulfopila aestuarii]|uniref:Membrane-bound lytic murein transglycosylase MltF n=1 Tax=Desulfopila aestuarii DSM 18488 TaxID=1121416 RepID=A0A1M7XYI5_9BACT|nr:lytic transglycosylase F [Desulfopila aestuarii]SHO43988.1 Membrane-bound lytic murein transglycosylase MltF [Desulfopila aestuarii DSM 18488]